jgi:hypothetical protein
MKVSSLFCSADSKTCDYFGSGMELDNSDTARTWMVKAAPIADLKCKIDLLKRLIARNSQTAI